MDTPNIRLAGRDFPVPPLALGQVRVIVPAMQRLRTMDLNALSDENFNDLIEVCYLGAQKGTPSLTKQGFIELPITFEQLLNASQIVAAQAGMVFTKGEAPAGEK